MPKIKNESYRKFVEKGLIDIMKPEEFKQRFEAIKLEKHQDRLTQWKAFLILLYWTGRRPAEVLRLRAKDFDKKGQLVSILFETLKGGRASVCYLSTRRVPAVLKVYEWAKKNFPEALLFNKLVSSTRDKVTYTTKQGNTVTKTYTRTTKNITYLVTKWFNVPPYFFRHNRFSDMSMKGASDKQLQYAKGAKDSRSVEVYLHLSDKKARETSRYIS